MTGNRWRLLLILGVLSALFFVPLSSATARPSYDRAIIFYSSGCSMCTDYIESDLLGVLKSAGVTTVEKKEYLNDPANRKELQDLNLRLNIPLDLQGHVTTVIDDKVVFQGHVPLSIMKDLLLNEEHSLFDKIAAYQDDMHGLATTYKIWAWRGDIMEYPLSTPIEEYLNFLKTGVSSAGGNAKMGVGLLLPVVISAGLLDGINPCAFAVMAFLVAFLFTLRRTRANILQLGVAYIASMYVTYFLIGLGLLKVLVFAGHPHLISQLGAGAVIILGMVNVKDFLFPNSPIKLTIPMVAWETIKEWMRKATLPSTLVVGSLVGLCTLPCSGGIYVAILGLLTSQTKFLEGLGYLAIYNLMYVAPLVLILILTTTRPVAKKLAVWERAHTTRTRLVSGLIMISLGVFILYAL